MSIINESLKSYIKERLSRFDKIFVVSQRSDAIIHLANFGILDIKSIDSLYVFDDCVGLRQCMIADDPSIDIFTQTLPSELEVSIGEAPQSQSICIISTIANSTVNQLASAHPNITMISLAPNYSIYKFVENKSNLQAIMSSAGLSEYALQRIAFNESAITVVDPAARYFLQRDESAGGMGTYRVLGKDVHKYIEGAYLCSKEVRGEIYNFSACIIGDTVLVDPPFRKEMNKISWASQENTCTELVMSEQMRTLCTNLVTTIGKTLRDTYGYQGLFGVDIILKDGKHPIVNEINARYQGTTFYHFIHSTINGHVPAEIILYAHLLGAQIDRALLRDYNTQKYPTGIFYRKMTIDDPYLQPGYSMLQNRTYTPVQMSAMYELVASGHQLIKVSHTNTNSKSAHVFATASTGEVKAI